METNYTSEMTMLITVSSSTQPLSNHHPLSPPPTLPKPGKDNLRLQRLLKKAARKNAILTSEQGKSFRSSLSPVNEASPDQECAESAAPAAETPEATAAPCAPLPTQLSVRPVSHRALSPFRRGKPFALKVTEQRRIAEHVKLTASSAMPLLQKPEAPETPQQPEGVGSHLPSPSDPSVSVFSQPPPSRTPSTEKAPEVTYITKVNTYFHSVKPPRAKTPTPNPAQGTVSHEDKRPTSPAPQTNSSEPPPEQTPTSLKDSKAAPPLPKPPLIPAAETEPPDQGLKPVPTEKPSTSDAHTNKPTTHASDTECKTAPESPEQDRDIPEPSTSSAPWRQARPATATPAQADGTGSTSTDTKAEHVTEPQMTPSLPNTSCSPRAEPAPSSGEAPRPPSSGEAPRPPSSGEAPRPPSSGEAPRPPSSGEAPRPPSSGEAPRPPSSGEAPRPPGTSAGGWHRLKKHLMVQPEAANFPESKPEKLGQEEGNKEDVAQAVIKQDCTLVKSKAMRMWDAILYQVALSKEKKQQAEEKKPQKEDSVFLPRRLPILLHKPRFDARKLKELAAKPMTKISTVFEVSRFRPRGAEEHTKSFNRTASGWSVH